MITLRSIFLFSVLFFTVLPPCAAATPNTHIYVIVSLVDNVSQGIVPVPAKIGNGDDPQQQSLLGCGLWRENLFEQGEWLAKVGVRKRY